MITVGDLIKAGYRGFHDDIEAKKYSDWYRASYQKRITDQYGTRYFITIRHSVMPPFEKGRETDFFTPSNQFRNGDTTFNVSMLYPETLEQVEAFFANLWEKMQPDYYEKRECSHD